MRLHHCRSIEHSRFGIVEPARLTEALQAPVCRAASGRIEDEWHNALDYEPAYAWVADHVGFWPLFLAVGDTHDTLLTTTYHFQFLRNQPGRGRGSTRCSRGQLRRAT